MGLLVQQERKVNQGLHAMSQEMGAQLIPLVGADSCMWASDYPHTDSTFPHSLRAIEEALGALPDADRRKVTATNCARLYGFADAP